MESTGQFEVQGNSETGWEFTNTGTGEVAYTFSTSGTWAPDQNNPKMHGCTAEGFPSFPPEVQNGIKQAWPTIRDNMKYPGKTPFALVAENTKTGEVTEVGKKASIVLKQGETLRFVLNDAAWWGYANNGGSITVKWSAVNLVQKVMYFDGDGDYVSLPAMAIDYSQGFTVEAWVCFDQFQHWSRIIDFSNGHSTDQIVFCAWNTPNASQSPLCFWIMNPHWHFIEPSQVIIERGRWMHLAGTITPSGNANLYKNGGDQIHSGKLPLPSNVTRTKNYIGANFTWPGPRNLVGKMAEVRLWNRVRSQHEIRTDMSKRLTGKEPNLVGYWPLDEVKSEGSILKVLDRTNNFHGTVIGARLIEDSSFRLS